MALQLQLLRPLAAARPSILLPSPAHGASASATALHARAGGVAFSLQTNVRLLKPNRRVRRSRDPYYDLDEDEDEEEVEFVEEDDDEGYESDVS